MTATPRLVALALVPLLLAACAVQDPAVHLAEEAAASPEPGGPVPVAIRLSLSGETASVLGDDNTGQIALARKGADQPVSLSFENGALAIYELDPGQYQVAALGPLTCRGLGFEVAAAPRYLGAIEARLVEAEYKVALMSRPSIADRDVGALAEAAGAPAGAVEARPLEVSEAAPCSLGPGPGTTWDNLTLAEKVLVTVGFAGFCAIAVASGGFCAF